MIVKRVEIDIRAGRVPTLLLDGQEFADKAQAFKIEQEAGGIPELTLVFQFWEGKIRVDGETKVIEAKEGSEDNG